MSPPMFRLGLATPVNLIKALPRHAQRFVSGANLNPDRFAVSFNHHNSQRGWMWVWGREFWETVCAGGFSHWDVVIWERRTAKWSLSQAMAKKTFNRVIHAGRPSVCWCAWLRWDHMFTSKVKCMCGEMESSVCVPERTHAHRHVHTIYHKVIYPYNLYIDHILVSIPKLLMWHVHASFLFFI